MPRPAAPVLERFYASIKKQPNGCWLWERSMRPNGYGLFRFAGTREQISAHRLSFQLFKGDIAAGALVLHSCDVKNCVNPEHLRLGTQSMNVLEAYARGRQKPYAPSRPGQLNGQAKLSNQQADEIRSRPETCTALAPLYGVSIATISLIRLGRRYPPQHQPT
jgi:hypothetical protein